MGRTIHYCAKCETECFDSIPCSNCGHMPDNVTFTECSSIRKTAYLNTHQIPYVAGDIFGLFDENHINLIVHQCNCFHAMTGGLAYIIANKFPEAKLADDASPYGDSAKLGTSALAFISASKAIANVYSQYAFGRDKCHTDYRHILPGILHAVKAFEANGNAVETIKLGIPFRYGSGLGGGDWHVVQAELDKLNLIIPEVQKQIVVLPKLIFDANHFLKAQQRKPLPE